MIPRSDFHREMKRERNRYFVETFKFFCLVFLILLAWGIAALLVARLIFG